MRKLVSFASAAFFAQKYHRHGVGACIGGNGGAQLKNHFRCAAKFFWKSGRLLESRPVTCYAVCLVGSFATSCVTTVCLWLDSLIYDYYSFAFVFGSALIRFGKDIVIVAIVTTIVIPLMKLLRRGGLVPALN